MNARSFAASTAASRSSIAILLAAAALVAACSSTASPDNAPASSGDPAEAGAPNADAEAPDAAPTGEEIDAACADWSKKLCAKLETCNSIDFALRYDTPAVCTAREALQCGDRHRSSSATITLGWQASCTAALDAYDCHLASTGYLPDACKPTPGKSTSACAWGSDCQSGFCEHVDNTRGSSCGLCAVAPVVGSACGGKAQDECGFGLTCADKKCARAAEKDAACSATQPCVAGFECWKGTCAIPLKSGDTCDLDALATPPCDSSIGQACGIGGATICNGPAIGTAGGPCSQGVSFACPAGSCDVAVGICPAFAAEGASCVGGEVCAPGASCVAGACTTPSAAFCAATSG